MSAAARYEEAVASLPASGGGGCHAALLGVANLGAIAGVAADQCASDLRAHVRGSRHVSDGEIKAAVAKAFTEHGNGQRRPRHAYLSSSTARPGLDAGKMLRGILDKGDGAGEADVWELSPVRLDWPAEADATRLLRILYKSTDRVFIGTRYDSGAEHVHTVADWITAFETGVPVPEHIIPNPLRGEPGMTKDGKPSFRADACVARFRFAVLEFDSIPQPLHGPVEAPGPWPREAQLEFWAGALAYNWPVAALIDSGGKSVHAWLTVDAADAAEWTAAVEGALFGEFLVPLGVDAACKNEARLSRMPGHFRREKGRSQRILYLNPDAGNL
ncbi:MAG: hypothetical protein NTY01_08975 [Verrucomicrobia bacterium]|nr:hypothetical protein [Verrucomicrobiota bacterium]